MTLPNFESLFEIAGKEWPETVDLSKIQYQSEDRYTVTELGRLLETVEEPHIGSNEEVIMREVHWSIFTLIHLLAKNLLQIHPSSVRAETVKEIFKRRLQKAVDSNDLRWSAEDFLLAQTYLREAI